MHIPALLAIALTACPQAPVQEQQIQARGMTTPKDIMLHGIIAGSSFQSNQGFTLQNGSSIHANTGLVLNSRNIVLNGGQVSSTSAASCSDNSGQGFCLNGKPKFVNPIVVVPKPDVSALKAKYTAVPVVTVQGTLNLNSSSEITSLFDNKIVLVKGSVNLNAIATIKNAVLMVEQDFKSNKGITLENSRIISKGAQFNQTTVLNNSRIVTDEDLSFNGKIENTGISSVVSSKNLTTNQGVTSTSGELAVIANQNIVTNQSSSGKIALWAGGNVTLNQGGSLEGSVVAGGKVVLNQSVTLTKVLQHLNGDILGGGNEFASVTATLIDGGTVVGPDGVSITAFAGSLKAPIEITIEKISIDSLSPLPTDLPRQVSPVYRIRPSRRTEFVPRSKGFNIKIPYRADIPAGHMVSYAAYIPTKYDLNYRQDIPYLWDYSEKEYKPTIPGIEFEVSEMFYEGTAYVILDQVNPPLRLTTAQARIQQTNPALKVECVDRSFCPSAILQTVLGHTNFAFENYESSIQRAPRLQIVRILSSAACTTNYGVKFSGAYNYTEFRLTLCMSERTTPSGTREIIFKGGILVPPQTLRGTIRHEVFHAMQGAFYNTGVANTSEFRWFQEATAEVAIESLEMMKVSLDGFGARSILPTLTATDIPERIQYQTQDFWAFIGRNKALGLEFLRSYLEEFEASSNFSLGTISNLTKTTLGYVNGIRDAYWEFIKNQAYENEISLRGYPNCALDPFKTIQFTTGFRQKREITGTDTIGDAPIDVEKLRYTVSNVVNESTTVGMTPLSSKIFEIIIDGRKNGTQIKIGIPQEQLNAGFRAKVYRTVSTSENRASTGCITKPDLNAKGELFKDVVSEASSRLDKTRFIVLLSNINPSASGDGKIWIQEVAAKIEVPSSMDLVGNVGDTLTQNLTISNLGNLDSTLEYKQYFLSANEITLPPRTPVPTPLAGATARVQNAPTILPYPDEGELTPVGGDFLSPLSSSPDDRKLVVTDTVPTPSAMIPVEYKCNTTGTFNALINVVYKTGATDDNGVEIQEKAVVNVKVECLNPITGGGGGDGLGGSGGEPWLRSFDNNFFGFHGVGEFILSQNPNSGMNVQVRYVKGSEFDFSNNQGFDRQVSFNGAVALKVGSDRIGVYAQKGNFPCCGLGYKAQAQVRLNGQIIAPPTGNSNNYAQVLPDGGVLSWFDHWVTLISLDREEIVQVNLFEGHVGSVSVRVPSSRQGEYRGLLGNFDDNPSNDYQTRNGTPFAIPLSSDQLYLEWGESWRLEQDESLFDYEAGQYTSSFTDRSFPTNTVTLDNLTPQARTFGETACRAANIVDPRAFKACTLDVGLTGNAGWANIAKGLDPGSRRLIVAPMNTSVVVGERVTLSADLFGDLTSKDLIWNTSGGRIELTAGNSKRVEFVAPMQTGLYTVEVRSIADPSLTGSIIMQVNQIVPPIVQRLAVGENFNVLVNSDGTVSTWGLEITNSSYFRNCSARASPLVVGADQIQSVSAGSNYVVALRQGQIMAWGSLTAAIAEYGNVPKEPTIIASFNDWVGVSAASISGFSESLVSVKRDGTAWVWLRVYQGFYNYILKPFLIQGISDVTALSGGLLLKRDGTVWATVVTGNEGAYSVQARQISGLDNVVQVVSSGDASRLSNGYGHHLALKSDGSVWAWGSNFYGELGLGFSSFFEAQPQRITGLVGVKQIRVSKNNSFAITNDGSLWIWGQNTSNFPSDSFDSLSLPTRLDGMDQIVDIQGFRSHLMLLKSNRSLHGWGFNSYQQVACSSDTTIPFPSLILGITW